MLDRRDLLPLHVARQKTSGNGVDLRFPVRGCQVLGTDCIFDRGKGYRTGSWMTRLAIPGRMEKMKGEQTRGRILTDTVGG